MTFRNAVFYGAVAMLAHAIIATVAYSEALVLRSQSDTEESAVTRDTLSFEMHGLAEGVIDYHNHTAERSIGGQYTLTDAGVSCDIKIEVGGAADNGETITATCSAGYGVEPETAIVSDGDTYSLRVYLLGF